ncbi:hypothetical protein IW261DRAFT_1562531 [Armillaria novae-zelandiae]|uniref:Uncharacterized protein n=1 Tax=Armillaria novae-zelandiae TaxID=153914 RepID=A0AA39PDA8_9AGAR|nr:hypothetical protein IW261DRAFT_1562531 [Armillaria novae-zelandiae]
MNSLEPNADRFKQIHQELRWQESLKKDIARLGAEITAARERYNTATKRAMNHEGSIAERVVKKRRTATSDESLGSRGMFFLLFPLSPFD